MARPDRGRAARPGTGPHLCQAGQGSRRGGCGARPRRGSARIVCGPVAGQPGELLHRAARDLAARRSPGSPGCAGAAFLCPLDLRRCPAGGHPDRRRRTARPCARPSCGTAWPAARADAVATGAVTLTAADRFLQMAPLTFDVVLEELLPVWAAGGTAVLAAPGPADPARFLRQIAGSRVTVAEITTAYWSLLTRHLGRSAAAVPGCLRLLIAGGEPAPPGLLQRSLDLGLPIGHVYGVTEAAITSAIGIFHPGQPPAGTPVGAPLSNSAVHIIGPGGQPVPSGEQGEVWIGGQGLADGYAGDPELTARRFVTSSQPGLPPGRYYRTGDVGRWLEDGTLEILGRIDAQVKVKGIRVEPAEIEASLAQAPGVASGTVVAAGDDPEHRRLVAFIVPSAGQPATGIERAVRGFLQRQLPAHLVPASVIAVPAFPLTRHGKIDRQQLRNLYQASARPCTLRPGPQRAEAVVTAIWSTVLGHHPASPDQNFFDAGGNSLALLQIVTGLQDSGHDVSVDDFLRWPTARGLAAALDRQAAPGAEAILQDARAREARRRGRPRYRTQHEEDA